MESPNSLLKKKIVCEIDASFLFALFTILCDIFFPSGNKYHFKCVRLKQEPTAGCFHEYIYEGKGTKYTTYIVYNMGL